MSFVRLVLCLLIFKKVDSHCKVLDDEWKMILYKITEKRKHNTGFEFSIFSRKLKWRGEIAPKIIRKVIFNLKA